MIKITINKRPYDFPTRWEDVTGNQYVRLLEAETFTDQISAFVDVSRETLRSATIIGLDKIMEVMDFTRKKVDFPRTESIGPYKLPKNIVLESLGQFEDLRALLMSMNRDPVNIQQEAIKIMFKWAEGCAIYCQKLRDGQYDNQKAKDMIPEMLTYSAPEIIGNGTFFLTLPLILSKGTSNGSPSTTPQTKKKKPVSRS